MTISLAFSDFHLNYQVDIICHDICRGEAYVMHIVFFVPIYVHIVQNLKY